MVIRNRIVASVGGRRVIVGLGATYVALAAGRAFFRIAAGTPLGNVFITSMLIAGPGFVLLSVGYRLPRFDVRAEFYASIAEWCLGGFGVMAGVLVLYSLQPGEVVDTPSTILILTSLASVAGLAVGIHDAEAKTRTRELEERNRDLESAQSELEAAVHRLEEANDRLEDSNERLEHYREYTDHVLNAIHDVFYVVEEDGTPQRWNESLCEVTGYSDAEIASMNAVEFVTDDDREAVADAIAEGFETGSLQVEAKLLTRDGESIPYEFAASTLETPDGETVLAGIGRDITDRKARERALEESERRYRTLAENFPNGAVALLDDELRHTLVEGRGFEPLDFGADDLRGERVRDVYSEEVWERIEPNYRAALEGERTSFEVTVQGRTFEFRALPLTTDGGDVLGVLAMSQDITDRKARERELERRARQQQVVADLGQLALETGDLDELMHEASRQVADALDNEYCKVLDLDEGEELLLRQGVGWRDGLVGEATVSAVETDSQAAYTLANDHPVVVEDLETETRFGGPELLRSHDVRSGISTIIGPFDEPWGILGTHDTERKAFTGEDVNFVQSVANVLAEAIERQQYQEELEQFVADLEESNERLEQFAYAASHDLQEPLRMVSSYLQLIEQRYGDELDDDAEEFLAFAVDGAERMRSMIEGLLQYSRVETRGNELEPVDLAAVLDDACTNLEVKIEERDAEITVEPLPRVVGDEGQLRQVFQNLLSNAIEYSGEGPPRIRVSAERNGREWTVSVADEGIGIDPGDQERIFEVFQRLHGRGEHAGTGIGLALCERIVERHGGEIWVDSDPGEGATFSFTLPAVRDESDDRAPGLGSDGRPVRSE